jgi:hypothetical protein
MASNENVPAFERLARLLLRGGMLVEDLSIQEMRICPWTRVRAASKLRSVAQVQLLTSNWHLWSAPVR